MTEETTKKPRKLFEDGAGNPPRQRLREVKSFSKAKVELVDPEQVWRTKYKAEFCDKVIEMGEKGLSVRAFAATVQVSHSTLYKWAAEIPEFAEAMQIAEMKRHLFYEVTALRNLNNREFNTTLFTKLAQTIGRWKDEEDDRQARFARQEEGASVDPSQMTAEQRRERIKQLTGKISLG